VGLLRVLVWVYCGNLAESDSDALLEDLLAADRYQLSDMKKMCESMVAVTPQNAAATLDVACLVGAARLRGEALSVLSRKLDECAEPDGGDSLKELGVRVPEAMAELQGLLAEKERIKRERNGGVSEVEKNVVEAGFIAGRELVLSEEVRDSVRDEWEKKKEEEEEAAEELIGGGGGTIMSLTTLTLLVVFFFAYARRFYPCRL
jgi:hypothetical protein